MIEIDRFLTKYQKRSEIFIKELKKVKWDQTPFDLIYINNLRAIIKISLPRSKIKIIEMFKIVSKMLDTEQHSVQIAVHLPPKTKVTFFGSNTVDTAFFAGKHEVTISHENGIILFCSSGFSSVSDAYDFVQKLSACVCFYLSEKRSV